MRQEGKNMVLTSNTPSSWIFSSPSCRTERIGKGWKKEEKRYTVWLLGTSEKWFLTNVFNKNKRIKWLVNSSQLPSLSNCQYRDDHNNVYFDDKGLNEKAAPQRAVSFLHIKTVVVVDSILHRILHLLVMWQRFKQNHFFRGTLRVNDRHNFLWMLHFGFVEKFICLKSFAHGWKLVVHSMWTLSHKRMWSRSTGWAPSIPTGSN